MSNRRAEIRRIEQANAKQIRKDEKLLARAVSISRQFGVPVDDITVWQAAERERLRSEVELELAAVYQKRYEELGKEYQKRLEDGNVRLNDILDKRTEEIRNEVGEECVKSFNEVIRITDNYICLVNSLRMLKAIHDTWGYTKALHRFLENYDKTVDYMGEVGVKATLDEVNGYGLDLEFDSFEIEEFLQLTKKFDSRSVMKWIKTNAKAS